MRTYGNNIAEAIAEAAATLKTLDAKNYDTYIASNHTDNTLDGGSAGTATVPASGTYKRVLDFRPLRNTISITLNGVAASLVEWPTVPGSAGIIAVNYLSGELLFHSGDASKLVVATYKHTGTVPDAHAWNRVQVAITRLQADVLAIDDTTAASFVINSDGAPASQTATLGFGSGSTHYMRWNHSTSRFEFSHAAYIPTVVAGETVTFDDNILILNSNEAGTPSQNAGIEVERGTSANASVTWDETADKWKAGLAGSEIELVDLSSSQTLTNKTFTGPVMTLPLVNGSDIDSTGDQIDTAVGASHTQNTDTGTTETMFRLNSGRSGYLATLRAMLDFGGNVDMDITFDADNGIFGFIGGTIDGNGGGLTNLQSSQLIGALPAISGAALTGVSKQLASSVANQTISSTPDDVDPVYNIGASVASVGQSYVIRGSFVGTSGSGGSYTITIDLMLGATVLNSVVIPVFDDGAGSNCAGTIDGTLTFRTIHASTGTVGASLLTSFESVRDDGGGANEAFQSVRANANAVGSLNTSGANDLKLVVATSNAALVLDFVTLTVQRL